MTIDISTFKTLNAEANRINTEIQKAEGALAESKRQFDELCKQYEATYNQKITPENLHTILEATITEANTLAHKQSELINQANKNGVVRQTTPTPTATAPTQATQPVQPTQVQPNVAPTAPQAQPIPTTPAVQPAIASVQPTQPVVTPAQVTATAQQTGTPTAQPAQNVANQQITFGEINPSFSVPGFNPAQPNFDAVLGGTFGG